FPVEDADDRKRQVADALRIGIDLRSADGTRLGDGHMREIRHVAGTNLGFGNMKAKPPGVGHARFSSLRTDRLRQPSSSKGRKDQSRAAGTPEQFYWAIRNCELRPAAATLLRRASPARNPRNYEDFTPSKTRKRAPTNPVDTLFLRIAESQLSRSR